MPTNAELNLILRFRDQATAALKQSASSIGQAFKSIGESAEKVGRELKQVGRDLIQLGGIVTGYFTLAIREAANTVPAVRDAVANLGAEFSSFQAVLATAVVPILNEFANVLHQLRVAFERMDPQTRDFIIRTVFIGGILTLVAGTVLRFGGAILVAAGNVAQLVGSMMVAHPVIFAVVAAAVVLISLFGDWEKAIQMVARAFDVATASIRFFVDLMMTGILQTVEWVVRGIENMLNALGKIPGKFGAPFRLAAQDVRLFREEIEGMKNAAAGEAAVNLDKVFVTMKQGGGAAETAVVNARKSLKDFFDALKTMRPELNAFSASLISDLKKFWTSYADFNKQMSTSITSAVQNLDSRFTSIFHRIITEGMKAKDAFKEFGRAILETVATMIAKFLAFVAVVSVIAAVLAAFGVPPAATFKTAFKFVGGFHQGGLVGGVPMRSYHSGGEVMANLEQGEFVVNKEATRRNRGMLEQINNGGGAGAGGMVFVNNWNINATDAQSFRNQMAQNDDLVEAMFQRAVKRNNGGMRQATRV